MHYYFVFGLETIAIGIAPGAVLHRECDDADGGVAVDGAWLHFVGRHYVGARNGRLQAVQADGEIFPVCLRMWCVMALIPGGP